MIKSYFKNVVKLEDASGDRVFRILFDIFFAFLLFLLRAGMLLKKQKKTLLNPSTLIEDDIITIIDSKKYTDDFKNKNIWWSDFDNIKPDLFLNEMMESPFK